MYCRNCGEEILEKELICKKCDTKRGEGVNYCHNCGRRTSDRMDYCHNCGAKLSKIIPQIQRQATIKELSKNANKLKKLSKIEGIVSVICLILILLSFCVIEFRPEPKGIPEPGITVDGYNIYGPNYQSRFASSEVQDFWSTNIEIAGFAIVCFIVLINVLIWRGVHKKAYKKILKNIKEEKKHVL